jgi:hypothetical protein
MASQEKGGIAFHEVQEQGLVGFARGELEGFGVAEVHLLRAEPQGDAGLLGLEAQGDALARLDVDLDAVGLSIQFGGDGKELMGDRAGLNDGPRNLLCQALARAQIKGHVLPAPVIDAKFKGRT